MRRCRKELKAVLLTACLSLALMISSLVSMASAGPWFNESNYAYFIGEISSYNLEWVDGECTDGLVCLGPDNQQDPHVFMDYMVRAWSDDFSVSSQSKNYMANIYMVAFDYDGKDFYMSGTWEIQKAIEISAKNVNYIKPFTDELNITNVAVVNFEADITPITDFVSTEFSTANIKVFHLTKDNFTSINYQWFWYGDENDSMGDLRFCLEINGEDVGSFDLAITYGDLYDEEPTIHACIPDARVNCTPGELYVTGNWTDFTVYIEGVGIFSGKIMDYEAKHTPERLSVARTDVNHNRKIDMRDICLVAHAFGFTAESPRYDPILDFNSDSIINIADLGIVAKNFGKTY